MKQLCAVSLASLVVSALALADTVDNPGDFNLSFDDGVLKIGNLDPVSQISQLTIAGSVDGDGNVTIPAAGIVVPDFTVPSPVGPVTVRFVPLDDASGMLNPLTLLSSARTRPRCFLRSAKYCCCTNVAVIQL